jgi:hypothetical protein
MAHTYPRCYLNAGIAGVAGCAKKAPDLMWDILFPVAEGAIEDVVIGACTYRFVAGLTSGPGFTEVPDDTPAGGNLIGEECCRHAKCAGYTGTPTGGALQSEWHPTDLQAWNGYNGAWVKIDAGDGLFGKTWRSRPLEDLLDLDIPELSPEVYVPDVTSLRYAPIALKDDCPECHVTLKLCFCDSSLWPTCEDPAAYSVEVAKLSWTGAGCFLDEEHTVPSCTRNSAGELVCV